MRWLAAMLGSVRNLFRGDPWRSFEDREDWRDLPHVAGRLATEADVQEGRAVFFQAGGGEPAAPHDMSLPVRAIHHEDTGESVPVVIVQAERAGNRVIVGFRYYARGGTGVAMLEEMELCTPRGRAR